MDCFGEYKIYGLIRERREETGNLCQFDRLVGVINIYMDKEGNRV